MQNGKTTIIIAGYIVGGPLGGLVWHHLQYVLGLHRMGYEVLFVEDSDDYPSCYNPKTNEVTTDPAYGLQFINEVFGRFGLQHHWAYFHQPAGRWYGVGENRIKELARQAAIFLNLSGVNPLRKIFQGIPLRIFLDTDPAFTQIRHLTEPEAFCRAQLHNCFFTFGENFGTASCKIPDDGLPWQPARQPVVLDAWPDSTGNSHAKWITVPCTA
jgi:hypothetical protein